MERPPPEGNSGKYNEPPSFPTFPPGGGGERGESLTEDIVKAAGFSILLFLSWGRDFYNFFLSSFLSLFFALAAISPIPTHALTKNIACEMVFRDLLQVRASRHVHTGDLDVIFVSARLPVLTAVRKCAHIGE